MKNSRVRNQRVSNTRQRKQHLLEVSVRRDVAIDQRNRAIFGFLLKTVFLIALGFGLFFGGKEGLRRFLWENPDYFLSDVRVATDRGLTREQILSTAGIVEGRNIFTININKALEALRELPQVESVEVQRILPNRIDINIIERRPIAWVTAKPEENPSSLEKAFLIDARGVVMRTKTVLPDYLHLPDISGVEVDNLASGQRVQTAEMQAALELVRLNADSTRFQTRKIDLAKGYCLSVTDRMGAQITFGLDRVDLQLERLNRLLDLVEASHRELQTVNLLVERNTPVTFVEPPSDTEPEAPAAKADFSHEKLSSGKASVTTPAKAAPALSVKPAPVKAASAKKSAAASERATNLKKTSAPEAPSRKKSPASVTQPFRLNG